MKYLVLGSDPEAFLRDSQGRLVSAIGVIPGTKTNPHKTEHGAIQVDNILAEFNSKPAFSKDEFITNHNLIITELSDILKPLDLRLDFVASALADQSLLSEPSAREAGCDPDFNAWTMEVNEPADYTNNDYRGAGGHVHISFNQAEEEGDNNEHRIKMVKALDLVLGVPSVLHDKDTTRRLYYGKAGSYRPKYKNYADPYDGIEYRTLSNFWLNSEKLMGMVWAGVELAHNNLDELANLAEFFKESVISCINHGDSKSAEVLCRRLELNHAFI